MGGEDWSSRPGRGTVDWAPASGGEAGPATSDALATPAADRYAPGAVVGAGGMGRVEAVVDRRLGREVARKTLRTDLRGGVSAEARFAREIRVTARLDHPGIVPIFDAGRDPDGSPWYTMRLVRGRTLDDGLASADLAARLALVPRFLAACEAVAYAHANGVVHRDLKPSNILVGPFGETQVADWGIAREMDASRDDLGAVVTTGEGTRLGAVVGTPGWMSPEQERGEPVGPASDVYALGRVLRALLTGRSPPGGDVPEGVPSDLFAIAVRATAAEVRDRYPDAAALASDVAAWLAGRRVSAYAYPPWELARRLVVAWRAPIAVGALATVALLAAVAVGFARTAAERDRAVLAEEAMAEVLAAAHVADGVAALRDGDLGTARLAAARALALRDEAGVRGLVAALDAHGPRPRLLFDVAAPSCVQVAFDPAGETLACAAPGAVSLWPATGGAPLWTVPSEAHDVARPVVGGPVYATTTSSLETHDARTGVSTSLSRNGGGRGLVRVAPTAAIADSVVLDLPQGSNLDCGPPVQFYDAAWRDGEWLLPCTDWRFRWVGDDTRVVVLDGEGLGGPTTAAFLDRTTAIAGTIDGEVLRFDLDSGEVLGKALGAGPIRRLLPSPDGRLVAVAGERGAVRILAVPAMIWVAGADEVAADVAWRADGSLVTVGDRLRGWAFDGEVRWGVVSGPYGLDGVAVRDDGVVTLHDGSGFVRPFTPEGVALAAFRWQDGVVKEGEHGPDRFYAVGLHSPGVATFDPATWAPLPTRGPRSYRDLAVQADDTLLAAPWTLGVDRVAADGSVDVLLPHVPVGSLVAAADGRRWLAAGDPAGLYLLDGGDTRWSDAAFRGRATLSADGAVVWATSNGTARRLDATDGTERGAFAIPDADTAIGTSADGSLVAVGFLDGTARVWSGNGALLAVLAGHDERVSDLRFAGDWLVSASWDGSARRWAVAPMTAPPVEDNGALRPMQHTEVRPGL